MTITNHSEDEKTKKRNYANIRNRNTSSADRGGKIEFMKIYCYNKKNFNS